MINGKRINLWKDKEAPTQITCGLEYLDVIWVDTNTADEIHKRYDSQSRTWVPVFPNNIGPQGPQGNVGVTGPRGHQGNQGIQGERGEKGYQGSGSVWGQIEGDINTQDDLLSILTMHETKEVSVPVGGVKVGDILKDKSAIDVFETIFYEDKNPNLIAPSVSIQSNMGSNVYEIGSSQDLLYTATFDQGQINPPYGTSGKRCGNVIGYKWYYGGNEYTHYTSELSDQLFVQGEVISEPEILIGVQVFYQIGEQPKTLYGQNYGSPLPGGSTEIQELPLYGTYPIFATSEDINNFTVLPLTIPGEYIECYMVPESSNGKQEIQIPSNYILQGVQQLDELTNSWYWISGSTSGSLGGFDVSINVIDINGQNVNYTSYKNNGHKIGGRYLRFYVEDKG